MPFEPWVQPNLQSPLWALVPDLVCTVVTSLHSRAHYSVNIISVHPKNSHTCNKTLLRSPSRPGVDVTVSSVGGFKHQTCILSQLWRLEACDRGGAGLRCLQRRQEGSFLPLPAPGAPGVPGLVAASLCSLPVFMWPLPRAPLSPHPLLSV